MSIRITADSPADLPPEMCRKYGIEMIPLHIILDDTSFDDGVTITPDNIYDYFSRTKNLPKTASVSIAEYSAFFERLTYGGDSVIHFSLSSGISSTYHNAVLAAEDFENVYIIDTKSLTTAMSLVILKAVDMIGKGMKVKEIVDNCNKLTGKIKTTFIISNLEFLNKGGRCSSVAAFGANVLGIKPSIAMNEDGTLSIDKKYRGKFQNCIIKYVADLVNENMGKIDTSRAVFVRTAGVTDEQFRFAMKEVAKRIKFDEVIVSTAGCTITSHCGKGTFAFQFMLK